MADFDNTNRGVLFHNSKDGNENRPDYTGELDVEGKKYRIAAWNKTSKNGNNYKAISISEPRQEDGQVKKEQTKMKASDARPVGDISDEPINLDDIPF